MEKIYQNKELLEKLYAEHRSQVKVAQVLGCNHKTVAAWMKKFEIKSIGSQGARKHFFNEDYFEIIDTPEKAYWLGFIYADGGIYDSTDKKSTRLQINLKMADKSHLDLFQGTIGSDYKISDKFLNNAWASFLKVNSTKMCRDLINKGVIYRKSLKLAFPNEEILPIHLRNHFIRGYFDGDGSIHKIKNRNHYTIDICSNVEFLNSIDEIMQSLGARPFTMEKSQKSEARSLRTSIDENVRIFYNYIYKDATIFLARKKEKFEEFYLISPL